MARNLKTGWVVLATSGSVVHGEEDGREIKKEWLEQMAENYNARVFTAKIWPDHRRYNSGGTVVALKTQPAEEPELKGEIQLLGILAPNDWLIYANSAGEYTHPSIEVGENYLGKGGYFLKGLGVTDSPASAGVTELKFSTKAGEEKAIVFPGQQFNLGDSLEEEKSIFQRIFSREPTPSNSNPEQDSEAMNETQFQQLKEFMSGEIKAGLADIRQEFAQPNSSHKHTLTTSQLPPHTHGAERFSTAGEGGDSEQPETVSLDQFNQLQAKFDDLSKQFSAALGEAKPGTTVPVGRGGAEGGEVI